MQMYITKCNTGAQPLVIIKDGIQLSLGGDDNCGCADNYVRLEIAFFDLQDDSRHLKDHPLVHKYGGDNCGGRISIWNNPELMVRVINEFIE